MDLLAKLAEAARNYGGDKAYGPAGNGSVSFKQDGTLYIKYADARLSDLDENDFTAMDVEKLEKIAEKQYTDADGPLADMMAAVLPLQKNGMPSVECVLHSIFPQSYVLHLHPALVNGLVCGKDGEEACKRLFPEAAWVPLEKPGHGLAAAVKAVIGKRDKTPDIVFLQSQGVMIAAGSVEELGKTLGRVMDTLKGEVEKAPEDTAKEAPPQAEEIAPVLRALYIREMADGIATFYNSERVDALVKSNDAAQAAMQPLTPGQVIYCGDAPLYVEKPDGVEGAFRTFVEEHGYAPKIVLVENVGVYALGVDKTAANAALELFLDALDIAKYAEAFGGAAALPREYVDFLSGWRVQHCVQDACMKKRLEGKICIVTGGAQGFGEGIARGIAQHGGYVVVADMNEQGAKNVADSIDAEYGVGTAIGVPVNVGEEASVAAMVRAAVLAYGGVDVMVSCAGILIAGDVVNLKVEQFELVTKVNYTGYFLCAKYASVPMKIHRKYIPEYTSDIVEINSKSGLSGSKNNSAYAGSKFGGVGLTQSFALEFAPFGIKVNAICPGNLLDGPLWTDPEKGLFKQYLDAGKVPGAKTTADVRRYYEQQVPMDRGCYVSDVIVALLYAVEQQYETGQAIAVTGGQVMLR